MHRLTKLTLAALSCSLTIGCKKDPKAELDAALAPYKPGAIARVDRLKALAPSMKDAPAIADDGIALEGGPPVAVGPATTYEAINASYVYQEDLGDVTSSYTSAPIPVDRDMLFGHCAAQLAGQGHTPDHLQAQLLKNCANARYAVLVRTTRSQAPKVDEAAKRYVSGFVEGEVNLWDLDKGKRLGGFHFAVRNEDQVEVDTRRWAGGASQVDDNLADRLSAAINAGLKKYSR